jgi:hypothetical protein
MPWYGYLISGIVVYIMGFVAGRSAGASEVLQKTMMPGATPGMPDMGALLKGMPVPPAAGR